GTPPADPTTTKPGSAASVSPTPSAESSPTPTASATPALFDFDASVAPSRPDGLSGPPSEETVGEAARYFVALFPYIFATGDLAQWESVSGSDCEWCGDIADVVRKDVAAGKRREGGRMDIQDLQVFHDRDEMYYAVVRLKEQPSRVLAADGSVVETTDFVQDAKLEVGLGWTGETWSVTSVGVDLLGTS
ncbi:DUF6318 family protein, partial [Cellulomonas persica]|uniref:DUF6318 family protein n=1 Tax=Cellulomonas persica TaxID=76861 RepID=UPI001C990C97